MSYAGSHFAGQIFFPQNPILSQIISVCVGACGALSLKLSSRNSRYPSRDLVKPENNLNTDLKTTLQRFVAAEEVPREILPRVGLRTLEALMTTNGADFWDQAREKWIKGTPDYVVYIVNETQPDSADAFVNMLFQDPDTKEATNKIIPLEQIKCPSILKQMLR